MQGIPARAAPGLAACPEGDRWGAQLLVPMTLVVPGSGIRSRPVEILPKIFGLLGAGVAVCEVAGKVDLPGSILPEGNGVASDPPRGVTSDPPQPGQPGQPGQLTGTQPGQP